MANNVVRTSPIPAGRYWVDCIGNPAITEFDIWRRSHSSVTVEVAEADLTASPPRAFYIFNLSAPTVRWEQMAGGVGLPTVAPPNVKSKADAMQVPMPESGNPFDFLNSSSTLLLVALGLFLLLRKK